MVTVWYPKDRAWRPLQVSFYVVKYDGGNFARVHETELVDHLSGLHDFVEPHIIRGEGAVVFEVSLSMTYRGRELLGTDGAIEVVAGVGGPNSRRDDGGPVSIFCGSGHRYQFHDQGALYHYRYTVDHRPIHDLMLPADETNLEWTLLNLRIERIKIELGDPNERLSAESLVKRYGPDGLIAYTFTAPLEQVFTQPRPEHIASRL